MSAVLSHHQSLVISISKRTLKRFISKSWHRSYWLLWNNDAISLWQAILSKELYFKLNSLQRKRMLRPWGDWAPSSLTVYLTRLLISIFLLFKQEKWKFIVLLHSSSNKGIRSLNAATMLRCVLRGTRHILLSANVLHAVCLTISTSSPTLSSFKNNVCFAYCN